MATGTGRGGSFPGSVISPHFFSKSVAHLQPSLCPFLIYSEAMWWEMASKTGGKVCQNDGDGGET